MSIQQEKSKNQESGVALIAAVLAVTILMVIGVSFAFNMRLEEKAAFNFMNSVRAKQIAQAGVERAIAALRIYANDYASYYPTSSWLALLDGSLGDGTYDVTVTDTASRIYLNRDAGIDPVNTFLDEMLEALPDIDSTLAEAIINYRNTLPGGRFITKEQVKGVPGIAAIYAATQIYLTAHTWVNPATDRAPVNVNTASREVLIAVLEPLTGITPAEAAAVADHIIGGGYRPIRTWAEFDACIDAAYTANLIDTNDDATRIKNNANPNRTKPSTYTTEFSFNSGGYFEIESTGRVYDLAGEFAGESKIRAVVNIFDIWHQTTEAEFIANTRPGIAVDMTLGQIYVANTGIYSNDFEINMTGWNVAEAVRVTGLPVSPPSGNYAVELEGGEETYLSIPNQLRTLYVSMQIYAVDTTVDSINVYLSYGVDRGPDIKMASIGEIQYHDGLNYVSFFSPGESSIGWKRVEFIVDVLDDTYNIYVDEAADPERNVADSEEIGFRSLLAGINRINIANLAAATTVYFDDIEIRCGGPMTAMMSTSEEISSWGTIAWTETAPTSWNEIKFELSDDDIIWRGPDGSSATDFYTSARFGSVLDEGNTTVFYCDPAGTAIPPDHDPPSLAIDTLYYLVTLSAVTINPLIADEVTLDDVTITYLPEVKILYWREVTE